MQINFIKNFALAGRRVAGVVGHNLKQASPEILLVAGIVGVVASTVMACKATKEASDILEEHNNERDALTEPVSEEAELVEQLAISEDEKTEGDISTTVTGEVVVVDRKALMKTYCKTGVRFIRLYGPAVVLGAASIACIFASHGIMRKRNAGLLAAYSVVENGFSEYRSRVRDILGEEAEERLRLGIEDHEIEETSVDDEGNETSVVRNAPVFNLSNCSPYARYFDQYSVSGWQGDEIEEMFLDGHEQFANDRYNAYGYVMLNSVYHDLGYEETSDGQLVGWAKGSGGDDRVIFERHKGYRWVEIDGMRKLIPTTIIDFNVDGDVHKAIDRINRLGASFRKQVVNA